MDAIELMMIMIFRRCLFCLEKIVVLLQNRRKRKE